MPMVQYHNKVEDVRITKTMGTPSRMDQMKYWFKAARKAIPEIPEVNNGVHIIEREHADQEYIRFDLISAEGIKSQVIIMRQMGKDRVGGS